MVIVLLLCNLEVSYPITLSTIIENINVTKIIELIFSLEFEFPLRLIGNIIIDTNVEIRIHLL